VIDPSLPPVPCVGAPLLLGDQALDLRTKALVAGVVPSPRFGREAEVLATAAGVAAAGADLVDVSLLPRLVGPVARSGAVPVASRVASVTQAEAATRAGAQVILVPVALAHDAVDAGCPVAVVTDDLEGLASARREATRLGVPVALDATRWAGAEGMAREAAAIAEGCRLIRSSDVRRSRRVAEVMAAVLGARRPPRGSHVDHLGGEA
jgi:hypothetical protein